MGKGYLQNLDNFNEQDLNEIHRTCVDSYEELSQKIRENISDLTMSIAMNMVLPTVNMSVSKGLLNKREGQELFEFLTKKATQMGYLCFYTGIEEALGTIPQKTSASLVYIFSHYFRHYMIFSIRKLLISNHVQPNHMDKLISDAENDITETTVKIAILGTLFSNSIVRKNIVDDQTPIQIVFRELAMLIEKNQ